MIPKSISVFCGASSSDDPAILTATKALGAALAEKDITLIYGGGSVGLMGAVADSVLANGGKVVGVIPRFLNTTEVAHRALTDLVVVETMHERKLKMFELSEGFIALPGGFGTLEEIIEILTWQQLGLHAFPIAFLNVNGFYDHLRALFDQMEQSKLLSPASKARALFGRDVDEVLRLMGALA